MNMKIDTSTGDVRDMKNGRFPQQGDDRCSKESLVLEGRKKSEKTTVKFDIEAHSECINIVDSKIISDCPPNCQCRCHKEKSIAEVAIDMALLTANANQVSLFRTRGLDKNSGLINHCHYYS